MAFANQLSSLNAVPNSVPNKERNINMLLILQVQYLLSHITQVLDNSNKYKFFFSLSLSSLLFVLLLLLAVVFIPSSFHFFSNFCQLTLMNGIEENMAFQGCVLLIVNLLTSDTCNFWCSDFQHSLPEHHAKVHSGKILVFPSPLFKGQYLIILYSSS